jgi:sugar O-acyltransferase (sialic acid O-acetyltransferase NeuD family)
VPARLGIIGCGGHARSVADVALANGVQALTFVDERARPDERIYGFPVITPDMLPGFRDAPDAFIVGLGDNGARAAWYERLASLRAAPAATIVAADVHVGRDARIGAAVFVGCSAHIGPSARIGANVIINTRAIVEHESVVGAHSHVAVNAVMLGRTRIGERVLLGAGAVVLDGVCVTSDVTIGAGAVVASDIDAPGTYVGVPARRLSRSA